MLIGLPEKKFPTENEFQFLIKSYSSTFKMWSIKEIEHAVELTLNGTIQSDLKLYGNQFSMVLISDVISKYKEWRKNESDYKKLRKPMPEKEKTPEEIYQIMRNAALKAFELFKEGDQSDCKHYIFDWLNRNKFLEPTPERKRESMRQAENELLYELEQKKVLVAPSQAKILMKAFEDDKQVKINRAKEWVLIEFFKALKETDSQLKDLI